MKKYLLVSVLLVLTNIASAGEEATFYPVPGTEGLPFSEAVQVGDLLFLAGKLGTVPGKRELAAGGIQGETRQSMENIKTVVERHGASMNDVVKCTVFMADIAEWASMNEVYVSYFPKNRPARSALGVSGLALNARVEIECIVALSK